MTTIGERVRAEREAQGISRSELSRRTGIGYSTLAELENGGMKSTTKLHVIADELQLSVRWLESGKGEKTHSGPSAESESQPERFDDATMAQAVELLYMLADNRPDDRRFDRLTWPMIRVAAKTIARKVTGMSQRELNAEILAAIDRGDSDA